jgi:hypothetical protein
MPKRTDISTILIIGAGPIVIGQACEFDYSGTQACKALKAEGYRIVLVNSNPATIMTDPDLADATYIEPITPEVVAKIIEKERTERPDDWCCCRPWAARPRSTPRCRSTSDGRARALGRRDDRREARGHRQGRGPRPVPRGDGPDRPGEPALGSSSTPPRSRTLTARMHESERARLKRSSRATNSTRRWTRWTTPGLTANPTASSAT